MTTRRLAPSVHGRHRLGGLRLVAVCALVMVAVLACGMGAHALIAPATPDVAASTSATEDADHGHVGADGAAARSADPAAQPCVGCTEDHQPLAEGAVGAVLLLLGLAAAPLAGIRWSMPMPSLIARRPTPWATQRATARRQLLCISRT